MPLTIAGALVALAWLILRSGTRPSRLTYPCQQAACATVTAALGLHTVAVSVLLRRGLAALLGAPLVRLLAGAATAAALLGLAGGGAGQGGGAGLAPPIDYHPEIFVVRHARGPEAGRHGGVDDLIALMGSKGLKWYRASTASGSAGPEGLIGSDSVVLLKVNGQWPERGGTSTDLLRGVMRCIVEHPDGFTGEIIVADNGQGAGDLDRDASNAEDHGQSFADVVADFAAGGWRASTALWDRRRYVAVDEYAGGDSRDGYVVSDAYDPETRIKVSYPKFRTPSGTYVSYKFGIWSPGTESYDPEKLVVINMPVLKTHFIYGITACVKHHMGVVTRELGTDAHYAVGRGGMGTILAEVRMPDLNLLDCTWILARPGSGPDARYTQATRCDQLAAARDPVALDMWAAKRILMPAIVENGYTPDAYRDTQDPDNPASVFRSYLDRSLAELLRAGITATNDPESAIVHVVDTARGDFVRGDANGDGSLNIADPIAVLLALFAGRVTLPCEDAADANDDGALDISDALASLGFLFLGAGPPPPPFPAPGPDPSPDALTCATPGPPVPR